MRSILDNPMCEHRYSTSHQEGAQIFSEGVRDSA
uniref:Uncharacterized protein n=1 Tax=Physcomitrium patens TaxID=3218 RepID=A0A7I4FCA7_PHYPA